jgi:hypothetical protein
MGNIDGWVWGLFVIVGCGSSSPDATEPESIWVMQSASIDPHALPLRDQGFTSVAKQGSVYVCEPRMFMQTGGPGARAQGDWLDTAKGTFDITKKPSARGHVMHDDARLSITTSGDRRVIAGNGLPVGVPTGVYPIADDDPTKSFDGNPNAITAQEISFSIPANPSVAAMPSCTYKIVGITLDGVELHVALDSEGRDELAYQIQDACSGASQPGGAYHRHALSDCTPHVRDRAALIGYALDGFGITSPFDADGNELRTADLDECHGTTSEIEWDGERVTMYHYVATRDFPYTVSCFRGTPVRNAFPSLPGAPPEH